MDYQEPLGQWEPIKKMLESNGYSTFNLNYPSRKKPIEELSKFVIHKIKQHFYDKPVQKFHFVTHSMGGIILREIMKSSPIANIGRVVMLGPPNQGSEIVDKLAPFKLISLVNGPACVQLGTSPTSYIHTLGPVQFELGVIAGNRSINPFLSYLITGLDDGKVSVERTKVDGMKDFRGSLFAFIFNGKSNHSKRNHSFFRKRIFLEK